MKNDFRRLNTQTSQKVLATYRSRKEIAAEAFSPMGRRIQR
jgi:hypothetical protein